MSSRQNRYTADRLGSQALMMQSRSSTCPDLQGSSRRALAAYTRTALRLHSALFLCLIVAGASACSSQATAVDPEPQDPHVLDSRPSAGWSSAIASDGNVVALAYSGPFATGGIYLAVSNDGGASFDRSRIALVDAAGFEAKGVAVVGRTIFVAYGNESPEGRFARSDDAGETFALQTVAIGSFAPAMVVSGDAIQLAYRLQSSSGLFTIRSGDGGLTWSEPVEIISGDVIHRTISLVAANGVLHASFYDLDMDAQVAAHSSNAGETWTVEPGQPLLSTGSLVATGERIVLPLVDPDDHLFVSESQDAGANWTHHAFDVSGGAYGDNPLDNLAANNTIAGVRLAVFGTTTYAIFNRGSSGDSPGLGFARSADGGATWPAGSVVTVAAAGSFPSENAGITVSTAPVPALLVAFYTDRLWVLRSTDDGATWPQ